MENWYAIVREATGQLESVGSVVAPILPLGLIKIPIDGPPRSDQVWNEKTQEFVTRPPQIIIDRIRDFETSPGVPSALCALTQQDRESIKNAIVKILGQRRYRTQGSEVDL